MGIKVWSLAEIMECEGDDDHFFAMKPLEEYELPKCNGAPARILGLMSLDEKEGKWLVHDGMGRYFNFWFDKEKAPEEIHRANSGRYMGLCHSRVYNAAVTIGEDGYVRVWNYAENVEYCSRWFPGRGASIDWIPENGVNKGRLVVAGFQNGVLRILALNKTTIALLVAVKVHDSGISMVKFSNDGSKLAVVAPNGDIFFLEMDYYENNKLSPFCLYQTNDKINDLKWNKDSNKILVAFKSGQVHEIDVPSPEDCDTSETFIRDLPKKVFTIKMMESQKPKEDDSMDFLRARKNPTQVTDPTAIEWDPEEIFAVDYMGMGEKDFVCTVAGKYLGYIYICNFEDERPKERSLKIDKCPIRYLSKTKGGNFYILGRDDGQVQFKHVDNPG